MGAHRGIGKRRVERRQDEFAVARLDIRFGSGNTHTMTLPRWSLGRQVQPTPTGWLQRTGAADDRDTAPEAAVLRENGPSTGMRMSPIRPVSASTSRMAFTVAAP